MAAIGPSQGVVAGRHVWNVALPQVVLNAIQVMIICRRCAEAGARPRQLSEANMRIVYKIAMPGARVCRLLTG